MRSINYILKLPEHLYVLVSDTDNNGESAGQKG